MMRLGQWAVLLVIAVLASRPSSAAPNRTPDVTPCAATLTPDLQEPSSAEPLSSCDAPEPQPAHVIHADELREQFSDMKLPQDEIRALILNAKTPSEHQRLAGYYSIRAENDLAQATRQQQMAIHYSAIPVTNSSKYIRGTVDHCVAIGRRLKQHAAKMRTLQKQQEMLARQSGE